MSRPIKNTTGYYGEGRTRRKADNARIYTKRRRDAQKNRLVEHFGDRCSDCGRSFPVCCYDFHHLSPDDKRFEIAPRMNANWDTLFEEAQKCVMICSNCHRIRHYESSK